VWVEGETALASHYKALIPVTRAKLLIQSPPKDPVREKVCDVLNLITKAKGEGEEVKEVTQ
jgi:hypothetical protein